MSLRETFSNRTSFTVINIYGQIALVHISTVLQRVLPCYLSNSPLKWDFLDIDLITFFGVGQFKSTSAMRVIFLLKMFKNDSKFQKCKKEFGKNFFSEIIASEDVAINSLC